MRLGRRNRLALIVGAVLLLLASLLAAHENHPERLPDPKDVVAFRHYLMENIGDSFKAIKDKLDLGRVGEAAVHAQAIALHATRIPELFPRGSLADSSRAKEEIWQDWDEFVKTAQKLSQEADQLALEVAKGNADTASTQLRRVANVCKSCHDRFRKPEEKGAS